MSTLAVSFVALVATLVGMLALLGVVRVRALLAWRNVMVGVVLDTRQRHVRVMPLPMLVVSIELYQGRCWRCGGPPVEGAPRCYVPWMHHRCAERQMREGGVR